MTRKSFRTYVVAGLVALGMAFAPAMGHAQTTAELQAQIQALLAQITALQAQLAGTGGTGGTGTTGLYCAWMNTHSFSRDLSQGSTGADVLDLQRFLNSVPGIQVAVSGAGAPGFETSYYGPATARAVSAFQVKYAAQILAPLGLSTGTGYFGASSRAQARVLCSTTPPPPTVEVCGDGIDNDRDGLVDENCPPEDDDDDDNDELQGGEADIRNFDYLNDPRNENVSEGDQNEPVMGIEFDVINGDVRLERVDVVFQASDDEDDRPWLYFDEVSLMLGDDEIASIDVDNEDDWDDIGTRSSGITSTADDAYMLRFTGLDDIIRRGDTAELYVAVTVADVIDSSDLDQDWFVWIPSNGIRMRDAAGINQYVPTSVGSSDFTRFTVEEQSSGDLSVNESDDEIESTIFAVNEDEESDEYAVLSFELEAEDAAIVVEEITITATTSEGDGLDAVIQDVILEIGGEEFNDSSRDDSGTSGSYTFEDLDFVIDEDDTVEVVVLVTFRRLSGNYPEGTTISFAVNGDNIEAEGEASGDDATVEGEVDGATHSLSLVGLSVEGTGDSETLTPATDNSEPFGRYTLQFTVTAEGEDVFIPRSATGTDSATIGVVYSITGDDFTGIESSNLSSSAGTSGSFYRVRAGRTESFTLSVVLNPDASGFYGVELETINFNDTASTPDTSYTVPNRAEFETDPLFIPAS